VPASIDDINELKILRGFWEWRSVFLLRAEYEARVSMRGTFPQVNARDWRMRECERTVCGIRQESTSSDYSGTPGGARG